MASIQEQQLTKFFEVLAASKLPSELGELLSSPSTSHYTVIQSGADDAQKISVSKLRGALGNYNASTNTPSLVNGTGVEGDSYVVTVSGTRDFGSGNLKLSANDVVEYRNGKWIKLNQISLQNVIDALSFTPEDSSLKGMANGHAPLNESIKIDAVYLPAYVEEIIEGTYVNTTTFNDDVGSPVTPVKSKIYLDTTSSIAYRWGGSQYLDIKASPGTSDAVAEGSVNLYYTNARVLTSVLTGFVTGANTSLTASDSVLSAFEKLQGQINALITSVASFADEVQPYDNLVNGVDGVLYLDAVGEKLYIWKNAAYVAIGGDGGASQAYVDAKVEDLITDGVLDKAPSQNAVFDALAGKQASLVSGTNIKTINNTSILGSGNLTIAGGGGTTTDVLVTDDLQSVIDTANAGAYIRITPGVHEYGINNNGQTQDAILYIDKSLSIEIMAGATIKLADGTIPLETTPEITTNQGVAKDLDDMTMGATSNFTGIAKIDYYIQIDGTGTPNTFKWGVFNEDGTYTLRTAGVAITGAEQTLEAGVKIKFGATTGHNINSIWYVSYDGKAHYGIRVGTGFHANYIEDVNIFGEGTIDLNITNNVQPSLLVKDIPACVFIHGRVRRCFTKDITMINAHRTFMAYGENNGTYEAGGNVSGGVSFDAEYIDIIKTKNRNTTIDGYGILLGHPLHRGLLKYVRCNENYIKSLNTCLEPNYLLREYEVKDNIIDSATALYPIHLWRRSDNGIVSGNKLMSELSGTRAVVSTGAPGGWDTAKNVTQHNNYNLNAGKVSPYPPFSNSVNNATANMIAYYPLASNSAESLGTTSGINGVDTGITYASEAQFNGGTSKILIPDNNIFSFTDGVTDKPFTITFEAKVNDITSSTFINKITNATTGAEWFLWYDTQNLNIQLCDLSTTNYIGSKYTFTPTTATFYKIGITYNGSGLTSGIKIYVNGTSVGSAISAGTYSRMKNTTSEVTLGKTGWTEAHQLNGSIKNLRFYSEEKSQAGIAAINAL